MTGTYKPILVPTVPFIGTFFQFQLWSRDSSREIRKRVVYLLADWPKLPCDQHAFGAGAAKSQFKPRCLLSFSFMVDFDPLVALLTCALS